MQSNMLTFSKVNRGFESRTTKHIYRLSLREKKEYRSSMRYVSGRLSGLSCGLLAKGSWDVRRVWQILMNIFERHTVRGSRDSVLVERRTRGRKVVSSIPDRSADKIFFSRVKFLCWLIRCPFHSRFTAEAWKIWRSFCQKCRWQATPKHAYTRDSTKSEWTDYAVQAECGDLSGTSSHGTIDHSRLSSLNHCGLILAPQKSGTGVLELKGNIYYIYIYALM